MKDNCKRCNRFKKIAAEGFCQSCYQLNYRFIGKTLPKLIEKQREKTQEGSAPCLLDPEFYETEEEFEKAVDGFLKRAKKLAEGLI